MTKHWPGHSLMAPPALSHLGDHRLDSSRPPGHVARSSTVRHRSQQRPAQMVPQHPPPSFSEPSAVHPQEHITGAFMDANQLAPEPSYGNAHEANPKREAERREAPAPRGAKKKNYQRYPKPPYSYLAMIAMVIQRSPEKKLTLSEILKEISTLFPFFKGNYKGWRDSVRHNLSSYDCFVKVLKDPTKPQGKGNFWAVELSCVPMELLKRQNTAVSRQDETIFAQDLAPYILQGHKPESEPARPTDPVTTFPPRNLSPPQEDLFRPKLDSSFAIDSLLHSLRPNSGSGDVDMGCWGETARPQLSPPPRPRYASSARSVSASSASPASTSSSSSEEDWKGGSLHGKRLPPDGQAGSDGYEEYKAPLHKSARRDALAPPWELPTSYAKYAPPNAVAPPSMRFNSGPLMPLHGGLPLYGYGSPHVAPGHFLSHAYWPILPSGRVSVQPPPLIMDLDNMLQSVPPNKSVFDALMPPNQNSHHQPPSQYTLQNGSSLNRYPQY
ncbi:forkhead box protein H1 [Phyllopteryx taeniolatus]|uniref:forkhead box protein H1 n=1 Tax=Phyllopteryx taeniolatus TaxID=161469 RepID=UPI002AD3EBEF|nr:forkhead box protein H1 [Phyllopteryx taeniolatus]XP_061614175.1 forkhead box protein H1 [Phyllopteryx taeniolatus]XP_061614176.1 forkhead box protein H1 [Phyllopteryx taeniolatus]XP_061614177.1 forkhead box protein H1 [Phyllopteryx taeniolatus]XP_061614178.1 forkhead box protein H1 [Phyllopteryx taeniolatus]